MSIPGIYCISNSLSSKKYIGSSANVFKRMKHHFRLLGYGQHHNTHLQSAYKKYGIESFRHEVLLLCEEFELLRYEQFFIDFLKPKYNKNPIAGRSAGSKRSFETCAKLKAIHQNRSDETRKRIALSNTGKHQSEISKKKKSEKLKGRIFSDETRKKITDALTGVKHSPERIEKNRLSQLGRKASDETKAKMSASKKMRDEAKRRENE